MDCLLLVSALENRWFSHLLQKSRLGSNNESTTSLQFFLSGFNPTLALVCIPTSEVVFFSLPRPERDREQADCSLLLYLIGVRERRCRIYR